jgi:hypothetical protein
MKTYSSRFSLSIGPKGMDDAPKPAGGSEGANDFIPQNELERALVLAAQDPSRRIAFHQLLLREDLWAGTPGQQPTGGWRMFEEGEQLSLLSIPSADGRPVPALFTSEARVATAFGVGAAFVRMKGEDLLALVAQGGAVLNPGSPYGVIWTAEELARALGQPLARVIEQATNLRLGVPATPPQELLAALAETLGAEPRVKEAWFALAHWPEQDERAWLLDVRTDLSREELNTLLDTIYRRANFEGLPMDVAVNPWEGETGHGIRIVPIATQ